MLCDDACIRSEGKGASRGLQATTRMHTHMHMTQVLEISLWATRAFLSREKIALTGTPSALPIRQICVAFDEHGGKISGALASCIVQRSQRAMIAAIRLVKPPSLSA